MSAPAIISSGTASGGPPVGGSGSPNTIPLWSTSTTLTDSALSQSGAIVTNSGTFRAADGSNTEPGYTFSNSSGSGMYRGTSGTVLRFASSGTFAFGVSTSQNVLIGGSATTAPSARLQVAGIANNNAAYLIGSTTVGQSFGVFIEAGTNASDRSFAVYNSGATSPYLFVRGDGNVAIGTATPATANSRLTVAGGFIVPAAGFGVYQAGDHLTLSGGAGKNVHLKPNDGGVLAVNVGAAACDMNAVASYALNLSGTATASEFASVGLSGTTASVAAGGTSANFFTPAAYSCYIVYVQATGNTGVGCVALVLQNGAASGSVVGNPASLLAVVVDVGGSLRITNNSGSAEAFRWRALKLRSLV